MVEGRGRSRLGFEPAYAERVVGAGLVEDLEGDVALETGVSGRVDLSHAARSQRLEDLVRSEPCSRLEHRTLYRFETDSVSLPGTRRRNTSSTDPRRIASPS